MSEVYSAAARLQIARIVSVSGALTAAEAHVLRCLQSAAHQQGTWPTVAASRHLLTTVTGLHERSIGRCLLDLTWKHTLKQLTRGDRRDRPNTFEIFTAAQSWAKILADPSIGKNRRGDVFCIGTGRRLLEPEEIELYDLDSIAAIATLPIATAPGEWVPRRAPSSVSSFVRWLMPAKVVR